MNSFAAFVRSSGGTLSLNATFSCRWTRCCGVARLFFEIEPSASRIFSGNSASD